MLQTRVDSGLDGVIVADTTMSEVDGEAGRLIVRGQAIEDLVRSRGFEGVAALLWEGFAEGGGDEAAVRSGLATARMRAFTDVPKLLKATTGLNPVEGLRVGLGMLPDSDPTPHHYLVCGALPVFLAALLRASDSKPALAPDPALTTAQDLLRMIRGTRADKAFEKALDAYLATVTDHGFNASTFTARVVASTRAGLISSVLAALCALKGPLHGGAPGPVLDMFDEIGSPERAEAWLDDAFSRGTRLMGFGHRVYKKRDPRADVLKNAVASLPQTAGRLAFAVEVERSAIASCASTNRSSGSTPTSNTTRPCCWRRWKCRAAPSPPCSPSAAPRAGARMSSSRRRAGVSSGRSRPMSGHDRPEHQVRRTVEPRQVRARVPLASKTQRITSAPADVKVAVKYRRQKLPSEWVNSASVPSWFGRSVRLAERGKACASAERRRATPPVTWPKNMVSPTSSVCIGPPSIRSQTAGLSSTRRTAN